MTGFSSKRFRNFFETPGGIVLLCLGLLILTVGIFAPTVNGDFIQFDDGEYITQNAHVNTGFTWQNIAWSLRSLEDCNWHPLTWWSHMMDCYFYGLNPAGHHLTNVLIHGLNAVFVFLMLRTLTGACWRSLIVALLFGLHPLRVESVAWICERKDVLCGMFSLLTFWAYAKYTGLRKAGIPKYKIFYGLTLASFSFALMSKPMAVTVPCVLLLLDYWPLERWKNVSTWKLTVEKTPFFLLTAVVSVTTYMAQKRGGVMSEAGVLSFGQRFVNAPISYARYLGKIFWPEHLCALYPYSDHWPPVDGFLSGFLLLAISVFAFKQRRQRPYLLTGWLWFLGTLVPVIGFFVQAGPQSMADRYSYLPSVGISMAVVWSIYELTKGWKFQAAISGVAVCAVLAVYIPLTEIQIRYWKNGVTVWKHAIDLTQNNFAAHMRYGEALLSARRFDDALAEFQEAVHLKPDDSAANWLLANQLCDHGRFAEAFLHYEQSLETAPDAYIVQHDFGKALFVKGRLDDAIVHLGKSVEIAPDHSGSQNDFGIALLDKGELDKAVVHLQKAVEISPTNYHFQYNLGVAYFKDGQMDKAARQFQNTLALQPDFSWARDYLKKAQADETNSPAVN